MLILAAALQQSASGLGVGEKRPKWRTPQRRRNHKRRAKTQMKHDAHNHLSCYRIDEHRLHEPVAFVCLFSFKSINQIKHTADYGFSNENSAVRTNATPYASDVRVHVNYTRNLCLESGLVRRYLFVTLIFFLFAVYRAGSFILCMPRQRLSGRMH